MGHKVQSVQTLYEDSCALYNDIVEGSGDYSAKTIISDLETGILITRIEVDENGKYWFYTKGVANLSVDPVVGEDQIYGVIVGEMKLLTFIYRLVDKPTGMFIFVIIPLFYVIGSEFLGFLLDREEERRAKLKEKDNNEEEKVVKKKTTKKKIKKEE